MDQEPDFLRDVLRIALGVALGAFFVWAAAQYYGRYAASQALAAVEATAARARAAVARADDERRAKADAAELLKFEQQRRSAVERAARDTARRRREEAWSGYYQPSPECLASTSVECGNAYIRARREFERTYQSN